MPSVTTVIGNSGLIDSRFYDDFSRDRGTAVHLVCELHDLGVLDESTVDPRIAPRLEAWKLFTAETGAMWDEGGIERRVYSRTHHYAGTLDRLGSVSGWRTLVDIKSGVPHSSTALQTAAYTKAAFECCNRMAVHLKDDGKYKIYPYKITDLDYDFSVFEALLTLQRWRDSK